jgi:hypothetical protein
MQMPRGCLSLNSTDSPSDWTPGGEYRPNLLDALPSPSAPRSWSAGAYLVIHIFLFDL